jgi:hypothetical protein
MARSLGESAWVGLVVAALGAFAWLLRAAPAPKPATPPPDDAPSGLVAYFPGGTCPDGWNEATVMQGRLAVGVLDGAAAGATVGTPLGDREDRPHSHDYSADVKLSNHSVLAVDGSNDDGAAAKTYTIPGTTTPSVSGLPFIQMKACVKP